MTTSSNKIIDISSYKDKADEFLCLIGFGNYRVTIIIPNVYLDSNINYYYGGSGVNMSGLDSTRAVVSATLTEITFVEFVKGGADFSNGAMHVYYR